MRVNSQRINVAATQKATYICFALLLWSCLASLLAISVLSQSYAPLLMLFFVFLLSLYITYSRRKFALGMVIMFLVTIVCWVIVLNIFSFSHQISPLGGDAMLFYHVSSNVLVLNLSMESLLKGIINAPLAVKLWGGWYEFYAGLGVERQPWVGLQLNIASVLLSYLVLVRAIRSIDRENSQAFTRAKLLFVASGIVMLYASEHMRDAFVLLFVSCLFYSFFQLAVRPRLVALFFLVIVCSVFLILMPFLRVKLVLLPIIFLGLYLATFVERFNTKNLITLVSSMIIIFYFFGGYFELFERVTMILESNADSYGELAVMQSGAGSLGYQLVVTQPFLIRAVLGFFYLHFQPIPFWVGLDSLSTYHWFKSIYSLFNHVTLPFALLTCFLYIRSLFMIRYQIIPRGIRFSVLVYLAGFIGVAMSSLETRHAGVFLVPYIIIVCYGMANAWQLNRWRKLYFQLYAVALVLVYLAWAFLKFG